jgi:hypothetical protein
MTVAAPLLFPGSRTLSGWWRQLDPWRPRALWVGHLLLHRVEALVELSRPRRTDPILQLVLRALRLDDTADARTVPERLEEVERLLHLERPLLAQVVRRLEAEGLIQTRAGRWLTPLGDQAAEQGEYPQMARERRVFYFLDGTRTGRRPHFLPLKRPGHAAGPPPDGWNFDVADLDACLRQGAEWKRRHGFPEEVQELVPPGPNATAAWQSVILDRAERLVAALILAPPDDGGERLLGFAVQEETWVLEATEPVFTLRAGWPEAFLELGRDPSLEQWRDAWRAWCQPRGLPVEEVNTCRLERQGHRLKVGAPTRLLERLQTGRGDALRGKAWVLAGEGPYRAAAVIDLIPAQ